MSNATVGVEYVVLSDVFDDDFATNNHFVQALIVGTRLRLSTAASLGVHLRIALDEGPNLGAAGTVSMDVLTVLGRQRAPDTSRREWTAKSAHDSLEQIGRRSAKVIAQRHGIVSPKRR